MDLEIWQDAIAVGEKLFDLADRLESMKLYRFADQLRGSGLSMSNISLKARAVVQTDNSRISST
jgi:23S rRNA-intervening sequence protein